jgi:predicted Fe-S protein YdhL (DUF1289 family)
MKKSLIESPCISVCQYNNGICAGCKRTVEEIVDWCDMTDKQKQAVLDRIDNANKKLFGLF